MLIDLGCRDLAQRRVDSRLTRMFKITWGIVDTPIGYYVTFQRDDVPQPSSQVDYCEVSQHILGH